MTVDRTNLAVAEQQRERRGFWVFWEAIARVAVAGSEVVPWSRSVGFSNAKFALDIFDLEIYE